MNWNLVSSGKFYLSGKIYFNHVTQQFCDARDIGVDNKPAIFDANVMVDIDNDNKFTDDLLLIQFDKAVSILYSPERNFLLEKFNLAFNTYKKFSKGTLIKSYVMVSPKHTQIELKNNLLFAYIVSNNNDDCYYLSDHIKCKDNGDDSVYIYYIFCEDPV